MGYVASKFDKERSNGNARQVFLTSLWYLPCVMMLFLLHSRRWHEDEAGDELRQTREGDEDAPLLAGLQKILSGVRSRGRDLCVHESIAANDVGIRLGSVARETPLDGAKCPISLAK